MSTENAVSTMDMTALLDEIQTLTRHQARVVLRTAYFPGRAPGECERPMPTFQVPDSQNPGDEIEAPYCAYLTEWGVEGIGATWEDALRHAVIELRRVVTR